MQISFFIPFSCLTSILRQLWKEPRKDWMWPCRHFLRGNQQSHTRTEQNSGNGHPPHFINKFAIGVKTDEKRNGAMPFWRKVKWAESQSMEVFDTALLQKSDITVSHHTGDHVACRRGSPYKDPERQARVRGCRRKPETPLGFSMGLRVSRCVLYSVPTNTPGTW